MQRSHRLTLALKALRELGPGQVGLYAWYRLGLETGFLRWRTASSLPPAVDHGPPAAAVRKVLELPLSDELAAVLGDHGPALLSQAEEIVAGKVPLFGGPPVPLQWNTPEPLLHWTEHAQALDHGERLGERGDIKFVWEPGRFGWAYTLGRAYRLSGDERYAQAFWHHTEGFLEANPPYQGPHWVSAQEVALRLMALAFASQVFSGAATTPERRSRLAAALAAHATRIPPTLAYARAQNNNHLLTEAAGLYTAGALLPDHPRASGWRRLGRRWFNAGLRSQIASDGAYGQHSTNYHRLMLHAALWMHSLAGENRPDRKEPLSSDSLQRLAAATRWLSALLDPESGRVPNLGPNDGADILPLSAGPFHDFRPVLQAAAETFLGQRLFPAGPWDELALWLDARGEQGRERDNRHAWLSPGTLASPHILRSAQRDSWAYLRVARFNGRPGHADQLHLDLWWRGINVAPDAGTYLYNAPPPWDNALSGTAVHNTLTVDGRDQMTRAGRFLWLDWAQGRIREHRQAPDGTLAHLVAEHDGYRSLGLTHRRAVTAYADGRWVVEDQLLEAEEPATELRRASKRPEPRARLHWLLPDWLWELSPEAASNQDADKPDGVRQTGVLLRIRSPLGWVILKVTVETGRGQARSCTYNLARAGELLAGDAYVEPQRGWVSPTYGCKDPALSLAVESAGPLPIILISEWIFPSKEV